MKKLFIILVYLLFLSSCDKIVNKGKNIVKKTKDKIIHKTENVVNNTFPQFDSYTPDTEFNKERFSEYLEVEISHDISNIYSYRDFLGIDYLVQISFNCDSTTIHRIIDFKNMKMSDNHDSGLYHSLELSWWDKSAIAKIKPYVIGEEYKFWKYLWFDEETQTAYYQEFSM